MFKKYFKQKTQIDRLTTDCVLLRKTLEDSYVGHMAALDNIAPESFAATRIGRISNDVKRLLDLTEEYK